MKKMTLDEKIGQHNLLTAGEATTGSTGSTDIETKINDLKFYDNNLNYMAEPGEFELMIGTNSEELKKVGFVLK